MAGEAMTMQDVLRNATAPLVVVGVAEALAEQVARLTNQLAQLEAATRVPTAGSGGSGAEASRRISTGDVAREVVSHSLSGSLGLGFGLSPLISGIARLFGGRGGSDEPAPLVRFALPKAVHLSAGISESIPETAFAVDYGQGGVPRPVTAAPQITVQVTAMDSRSFLDHSSEIAMAVRQAMLESSVLNDVIREA